jgi:hypothetical protein
MFFGHKFCDDIIVAEFMEELMVHKIYSIFVLTKEKGLWSSYIFTFFHFILVLECFATLCSEKLFIKYSCLQYKQVKNLQILSDQFGCHVLMEKSLCPLVLQKFM